MFIHSFDKMVGAHYSFDEMVGASFIPFITTMMGLFPNHVKPWDGTIYPYMMIYP
jgi:hypothetical protein